MNFIFFDFTNLSSQQIQRFISSLVITNITYILPVILLSPVITHAQSAKTFVNETSNQSKSLSKSDFNTDSIKISKRIPKSRFWFGSYGRIGFSSN